RSTAAHAQGQLRIRLQPRNTVAARLPRTHDSTGDQTSGRRGSYASPDGFSCFVKLGAWPLSPAGVDAEAVAGCSGEDVKVDVKDLLERDFAVGQKEVHPLARKPRSGAHALSCARSGGRATSPERIRPVRHHPACQLQLRRLLRPAGSESAVSGQICRLGYTQNTQWAGRR